MPHPNQHSGSFWHARHRGTVRLDRSCATRPSRGARGRGQSGRVLESNRLEEQFLVFSRAYCLLLPFFLNLYALRKNKKGGPLRLLRHLGNAVVDFAQLLGCYVTTVTRSLILLGFSDFLYS